MTQIDNSSVYNIGEQFKIKGKRGVHKEEHLFPFFLLLSFFLFHSLFDLIHTIMTFKKNHIRIVPHLDTSHSLVFDIIERDLLSNTVLKIGRFTDRFFNMDRITFKSKVVSRGHAEIWVENDKVCKYGCTATHSVRVTYTMIVLYQRHQVFVWYLCQQSKTQPS